jgi:hypothetical protein
VLVKVAQQVDAAAGRVLAQGDEEAEPGRLASGRGFGQDEELGAIVQPRAQVRKIGAPGGDEVVEARHLRHAQRRLHVGDLEVVAGVGIGVLVVVAAGQVAELPVEALAAGVVLARRAIAVAAPVAEGFDDARQQRIVGEYCAALARGDVVRG